ncbi:MAG: LptA/OstA family protein [Verrucomicrobiota bacterium]
MTFFYFRRVLTGFLMVAVGISSLNSEVDSAAPPADDTVITSDNLELIGGDAQNQFFFTGNVKVSGTNMVATCDYMEVTALRSGSKQKTVGEMGAIELIVMTGNVIIEQAGRRATAGRAEIIPNEDKVVLTENPVVEDSEGTVSGHRMELLKGERKAKVFGDPATGGRTKVVLPGFQDLGYGGENGDQP